MSIRNKFCIALSIVMLSGAAYAIGQAPDKNASFQLIDGKWLNGLAGGQNFYTWGNITAKGTTQAGAIQLTPGYAMFAIDTVPSNSGVALPACFAGTFVSLYNSGVNTLNVYPSIQNNLATGSQDAINGSSSTTVATQNGITFVCAQSGAWSFPPGSGGGGSPGGSNSDVQYRVNSTTFGGIADVTSNGTSMTVLNSALALQGTSTGATTFLSANAGATNFDITFPAATGTLALTSGANVASVTAANGSLTISPNTGAVLANLNVGNANTWTASQTMSQSVLALGGGSSGTLTFLSANTGATNFDITVPASTTILAGLNVDNQLITGGAVLSVYQNTTGSFTLDCGVGPAQWVTNGGAFTITAPTSDSQCVLQLENNSAASTVTFTGFSEGSSTGDALTTTSGSIFQVSINKIHGHAHYLISALQ